MMNMVMFGATAAACAGKCPPHAIGALAGACAVSFLVGYFFGRRGKCCDNKGARNHNQRMRDNRRDQRPQEPRQPIPAGCIEIYVGNLSYEMTEEKLRKEFEAFGKVEKTRIVTNKFNNRSKGYGFVVMSNRAEADAAIAGMSEKDVLGRKMRVNEARNTIKEEA